ncbi:MAG: O-acetyl-ADP-ribose deacetylase [Thermodesulfobacteriota bacterium]|nr:O-acetyl-ADP-ribose deacetylase [Thermodesulfobacteriota bacterium]
MEVRINQTLLCLIEGDITRQKVDAVVNAANSSLRGGGGVDGAIHRAGGPKILEECLKIGSCSPGEAVITSGGNLKAKYVIHTVGPVWRGGNKSEELLLGNSYKNSLQRAEEKSLKSMAFPSISTGAYGYPMDKAARIALSVIIKYLKGKTSLKTVKFVLFGKSAYLVYERTLMDLL